jgi:hypothetical protein
MMIILILVSQMYQILFLDVIINILEEENRFQKQMRIDVWCMS